MFRGVVLIGLAACGYDPTPAQPVDGPAPDIIDTPPPEGCFGSAIVRVCPAVPPSGVLSLVGAIDTDTDPRCADFTSPSNTTACLIAASSISVGIVRATGSRPLVLLADAGIVVGLGGVLDVASHGADVGAAGDAVGCTAGGAPGTLNGASGGGGGGSFGGKGGDGSAGDNGGAGGTASAATGVPVALRGGCPGGGGGGTGAGQSGHGGGAVFLIAPQIAVSGSINASGSGGGLTTAGNNAGGGGGGSGGMIGLDSPALTVTGAVFANGGGGSEGGGGGVVGNPGGESPAPAIAAAGGLNGGGGGDGGEGSAAAMLGGASGKAASINDGGGGGGGGAGAIRLFGTQIQGPSLAPPPS